MKYEHRFNTGETFGHPLGKIVCVGRNYADHIHELNNPVPAEPLLFMKPATAAVAMEEPFSVPTDLGACHFETEIAILIGARLTRAEKPQAVAAIAGVGLAFDLTLRDLQNCLKENGQPWEKAKAFDGSCPLSRFVEPAAAGDLHNIHLRLTCNGAVRQDGNSGRMLTAILDLLTYISRFFTLQPGDVVLTGTPAGVGAIAPGDRLTAELVGVLSVDTSVNT